MSKKLLFSFVLLISTQCFAEKDGELIRAVECNDSNRVQLLLTAGANVNNRHRFGRTALMIATFENNLEMVQILLAAGANVNDQDCFGETVLKWAVLNNNLEMVRALLNVEGIDVNLHRDNYTALVWALRYLNLEIARILLSVKSIDVNIPDKYYGGNMVLNLAVMCEDVEIVQAILNNPNFKDDSQNYSQIQFELKLTTDPKIRQILQNYLATK